MSRHFGKPGGLLLCALLALLIPAALAETDEEGGSEGSFLIWRYGQCEIGDPSALEEAFRAYLVRQPADPAKTTRWIASEEEIIRILGSAVAPPADLAAAWTKFQKLSMDPMDRGECRDLAAMMARASGILARKRTSTPEEAELNRQREILTWNVSLEQRRQQDLLASQGRPRKGSAKRPPPPPSESARKLDQVVAEINRRQLAAELEERQTRMEFQELAMGFLRRGHYREAILAARFYKAIFGALIVPLRLGKDSAELLMPEGTTPTLQDLENIARRSIEAMGRGLGEATLLIKDGLVSAGTTKLAGIFAMGGGAPEVRAFPADLRARVASFLNLQTDLRKHLADGDQAKASSDLDRIEKLARDFDSSSLRSSIAAAKASARIRLPKPVIAVQGVGVGVTASTNAPATNAATTNATATNTQVTNATATNAVATNAPVTSATATNDPTTDDLWMNDLSMDDPTTIDLATPSEETNSFSTNDFATNTPSTNAPGTNTPATNPVGTNALVTNTAATNTAATNVANAPENASEEFDMLLAEGKTGDIVAKRAFFEQALTGSPERLTLLHEAVTGDAPLREGLDHAAKSRDSGSVIAAWEEAEALSMRYPGRPEITAFLTTLHPASEAFEQGITKARASEKDRPVDALNTYLRLQSAYPQSHAAEEGVRRMSAHVLAQPE